MWLRWLPVGFLVLLPFLGSCTAANLRSRREAESIQIDERIPKQSESVIISASSPSEAFRQAGAVPYASIPNGYYQPPSVRASDYKPLISSSQTQSVRYQPPNNDNPSHAVPLAYSYSQSSHGQSSPLLASAQTGNFNSVAPQPANRQGFSYSGDHGSANQFHAQPQQSQPVPKPHGVPTNDEYVVYYYYYYDNDTSAGNASNFDDIPSLESYDTDKVGKDQVDKTSVVRVVPAVDVNSLPNTHDAKSGRDESSQPRSVAGSSPNQQQFIRSDRQPFTEDTAVQPLKPVSNVYRYAGNDVPRLPVLPNFVVSDAPTVARHGAAHGVPHESHQTTQPTISISVSRSRGGPDPELDDSSNLVDRSGPESKLDNTKATEEASSTTSTEAPTTTEEPTTTTTEKSRRRPGSGGRRRFNPNPSFSSSRRPTKSSTSSTSTTTTTAGPGGFTTRGSFRGASRTRPRPTISSSRPRPSFSRSLSTSENTDVITKSTESTTSSTTTAKPRFGGSSSSSSSGRRFSSTRTRSSVAPPIRSASTTTVAPRVRPSVKPRAPSPIIRSRAPRPGFFRPKAVTEPEESETTTPVVATENSVSSPSNDSSPLDHGEDEDSRDEDVDDEDASDAETEAPTTTEKSRFSALFRPRNRTPLNRPRPILNRSRRS